jgi:ubiquinone/menaquinone biosynthesis C-methylase UbiE
MVAISEELRIKRSRWLEAQEYERGFWRRLGESIQDGTAAQLDWYRWRAGRLETLLRRVATEMPRGGKVLEIGSGPIGIVNFLEWGERFAIDPLEPFYRQQPALIELRNPGSTYLEGSGEHLPLPDASCSLVIIDNVIDHTYAPEKILQEISRVLAPQGRLYLCVNVHTRWGAFLHDVLAGLRIDRGHPYTFTSEALRQLLRRHSFSLELEEIEDSSQASANDRRSPRWSDRVKGWSGLSEFQHLVICSKARA